VYGYSFNEVCQSAEDEVEWVDRAEWARCMSSASSCLKWKADRASCDPDPDEDPDPAPSRDLG
jgi:hypothetical protein